MEYKYFAFNCDNNDFELFETKSQASNYAELCIKDQRKWGDEPGEEAMEGGIGWGKILEVTRFKITETKKQWLEKHPEDEWPFDDLCDEIGMLELIDVEETE